MQARVLDRHRELAREREQEALLTLAIGPRARLVDGQRADHLVVDDQRDDQGTADAVRLPAFLEALQARIVAHVLDEEVAAPAERAERELEQALGEIRVLPLEAARGRGGEPVPLA